jgi:hypothetical protein
VGPIDGFNIMIIFYNKKGSPDRNPRLPAGREPVSKVYCSPDRNPRQRQAGNYGTKDFRNSLPIPDFKYFSLTLASFQSAKYSI